MSIFSYIDYKTYIQESLAMRPQKGRGELSRLAKSLGVNATLISQILKGPRDFTIEQAMAVSEYLGLTDIESEYFLLLVQKARAGTPSLRKFFDKKIAQIQKESLQLAKRMKTDRVITDQERAIFYSTWLYSAVRMHTSIGAGQTVESVSKRFQISYQKANQILQFLAETGLCVQTGDSRFKMGAQQTHLEFGSPYLIQHLQNWRNKSIQYADRVTEEEMMFSASLSLGLDDFKKVREILVATIKDVAAIAKDSESEEIAFFNLDWLWVRS